MINVFAERTLPLSQVPKKIPGKDPTIATVYRWARRGVNGIKLETAQIGGQKVTSYEALARFFRRLTESREPIDGAERENNTNVRNATKNARQNQGSTTSRRVRRAQEKLDHILGSPNSDQTTEGDPEHRGDTS